MSARQGKILVAASTIVLTALLLRHAMGVGGWTAFAVAEVQLLVPMALSWWVFSGR